MFAITLLLAAAAVAAAAELSNPNGGLVYVLEGAAFTLECPYVSGINHTWWKNTGSSSAGRSRMEADRFGRSVGIVTVPVTNSGHAGVWTCLWRWNSVNTTVVVYSEAECGPSWSGDRELSEIRHRGCDGECVYRELYHCSVNLAVGATSVEVDELEFRWSPIWNTVIERSTSGVRSGIGGCGRELLERGSAVVTVVLKAGSRLLTTRVWQPLAIRPEWNAQSVCPFRPEQSVCWARTSAGSTHLATFISCYSRRLSGGERPLSWLRDTSGLGFWGEKSECLPTCASARAVVKLNPTKGCASCTFSVIDVNATRFVGCSYPLFEHDDTQLDTDILSNSFLRSEACRNSNPTARIPLPLSLPSRGGGGNEFQPCNNNDNNRSTGAPSERTYVVVPGTGDDPNDTLLGAYNRTVRCFCVGADCKPAKNPDATAIFTIAANRVGLAQALADPAQVRWLVRRPWLTNVMAIVLVAVTMLGTVLLIMGRCRCCFGRR